MNGNPWAAGGKRRVAVVIGSGSVKCAASLGLIRVLQREGIGVQMLVGCSAGAIFAAALATRGGVDEVIELVTRLWTRDITGRRDNRALLAAVFPKWFGFSPEFGIRDDRLIMRRLHDAFGDTRIEDLPVPLHLAATDFGDGTQAIFSSGRVVDALRASFAIPFMFKPHRVGDRLYTDGFLSDPLPVGVAIKEGADVIVAMGFDSPYQERINSAGRFAFQISSILSNNLLKSQFAFHGLAHHAEVVPIIPEFSQRIRLFDTKKIPDIIADGERATEQVLPYLVRLLDAADAETG